MQSYRLLLSQHLNEQKIIYLFISILFFTGIVFGSVLVNSMNFVQKQDLFFYLEQFFSFTIHEQGVEHYTLLRESFFFHLKYLGLISILGLSVIGLPVIWGLIFIKGLVIGFSVGFIVSQLGSDGLLFAAFTVVPHNLLVIPVYI